MDLIYKGKTKDVYQLSDGNLLLKFKDDLTGEDGIFDPGANKVGLQIEGVGKSALKISTFFFERIKERGISTHHIDSDFEKGTMTVFPAKFFGKGVEVICRYKAVGSFIRRYGLYAEDGQDLNGYVEVTLKDDERDDPLITDEALEVLDIMSKAEYKILTKLAKEISHVIKEELAKRDLELYDIKLEFGRIGEDNHIALIDEISGGNMRAYKSGEPIKPLELEKILLD